MSGRRSNNLTDTSSNPAQGFSPLELARTAQEVITRLKLPTQPTYLDVKKAIERVLGVKITLQRKDLTPLLSGYCYKSSTDSFLVVYNAKLTEPLKTSTIFHELMHIYLGDVDGIKKLACRALKPPSQASSDRQNSFNTLNENCGGSTAFSECQYEFVEDSENEVIIECISDCLMEITMPEAGRTFENFEGSWV